MDSVATTYLKPIKACIPGYEAYSSTKRRCNIRIIRRSEHVESITPNIHVRGYFVYCNGVRLDLSKRPMTLKVIKTFSQSPKKSFNRSELVKAIYESFQPDCKSERFNDVLRQNITRLISRARTATEGAFNVPKPWIEFFVYDPIAETWSFYRLKNEYIQEKERKIYKMLSRMEAQRSRRGG